MAIKTTIIPSMRQVYSAAFALLPDGRSEGDLGYATDEEILYRWDGAAWQPISSIPITIGGTDLTIIAGATLRNSNDAERSIAAGVYTLIKETRLNADLPECRVKYEHKRDGGTGTGYFKLYKNGVAEGSEITNNGAVWTEMSEDLSGFVNGDLLQVYAYLVGGTGDPYVRNFRFHYDATDLSQEVTHIRSIAVTAPIALANHADISAISVTNTPGF